MIWLGRRKHWPLSRRFVSYCMVVFACIWSAFVFSKTYGEYASLRSDYRKGRFSVVEGKITNFHPMPYEGHQEECFSVLTETFCYSDYVITGGFNNTASHGGPIREGLPVRVSYIAMRLFVWKSEAMRSPVWLTERRLASQCRKTGSSDRNATRRLIA
jgi:hypothetical protein